MSLLQLPAPFLFVIPLVLVSMLMTVAKHGLLLLARSVQRVWLTADGWYLGLNNGVHLGPFVLDDATRLERRFVRLSLRQTTWKRRHLIINREMIGEEQFRRLTVFLRWAEHKGTQQPAGENRFARFKQRLTKWLPVLNRWMEH